MTTTNPAAATEATEIHYTVIDRDNGERYSTTSSTSRERVERERNRLALKDGKIVALGIGRIAGDGSIDDVTEGEYTCYEIKTGPEHHTAERPWMRLASTTTVEAKAVGAICTYAAQTTDPTALEAALEADSDVIEYRAITSNADATP